MNKTLWTSLNGEVVCPSHGGSYLASAIKASPRKRRHDTPITSWERLTAADVAYLASIGLTGCDYCPKPA
jgi:hypothetical protein